MEDEAVANREANLKETIRFWRAWKTVHQMCQDRVCDITSPSLRNLGANAPYVSDIVQFVEAKINATQDY